MAVERIYNIREGRQTGGLLPIQEVLASNYEMFRKLTSDERDQYVGIPTGISDLDAVTSGLNRSDLIIVGILCLGMINIVLTAIFNMVEKRYVRGGKDE